MSRSRVSGKSDLSPSITRGSDSGLDLGKNSGVDMGQKSQVSNTSGGIGITQEVTKIGGVGISLGVGADITPVDFGISIDPTEKTISIASGAEVPGGLLGVSGGIEIDMNTGRVIGGSIGGEIGGLGINVSKSAKGGLGVEFTLQIPGTPIEFSFGLSFPLEEEPTLTSTPPSPKGIGYRPSEIPPLNPLCTYHFHFLVHAWTEITENIYLVWPWTPGRIVWENRTAVTGKGRSYITGLKPNPAFPNLNDITHAGVGIFGTVYPFGSGSVVGYQEGKRPTIQGQTIERITTEAIHIKGFVGKPPELDNWIAWNINAYHPGCDYFIYPELLSCPADEPPPPPLPPPAPLKNSPFPNPPPRKRKKMDECCKLNLAFLRLIYTRLGLAKFPGKLPSTIIQEVQKEGEAPSEPPQVPIPDLVSLLDWMFKRDDERWGQWEVQIDIKDSDITKEGDQGKSIKFPNLAESIAEFEGQLLSIMTNVDAMVALQVKTLAESGMARQESIKAYLASKAIIKYMAFKSTEIDIPVPMTFTAGAESISDLLQESEGHIKGTDYVEKETLRDVYLDLLQAAAIIRAVHWQRIDTKSDTKSQLLNILQGSVNLAASIATPQSSNGSEEKTFDPEKNFEDFIDSVEDGFRNTTGITDIQNPYGKPPNQRPRIRQIGNNISQAGGSD